MRGVKNITLLEACAGLQDPRADRENKFPLVEILFACMITVLCGARSFVDMEVIGKDRLTWFRRYLPYTNGIPSAGTMRRILGRLDPDEVHSSFVDWTKGVLETLGGAGVLAIDGKTSRGSKTKTDKPIHIVSAFASAANLVIGQLSCDEKSNEITAIPELLKMLDIHGCLVTIDAMGTQTAIAEQITQQGGDWLLQVKGNQKFLHGALKDCFSGCFDGSGASASMDRFISEEDSHGRHEIRECLVQPGQEWMGGTKEKWPDTAFGAVIRSTITRDGKTTVTDHWFIGSREGMTAKEVLKSKRIHWAIENSLHWCLDVQMGEDANKVHTDHAAENLNALRHIALNVLRETPGLKGSLNSRMLHCAGNDDARTAAAKQLGFEPTIAARS